MTQQTIFDVAIVGGGPAGASAALRLRALCAGARILVLEAGAYPRHKVCGEFVSREGVERLRFLHLCERLQLPALPQLRSVRVFAAGSEFSIALDAPATSVARFELDSAMWRACEEAGVTCLPHTPVNAIAGSGPFHLRCGKREFASQAVINAAGRWSSLSTKRTPVGGHKWLGLKAHYEEQAAPASVDLYFFDGGYCGVQPIGPGEVNVCALVRADAATTLERVCALHPDLRRRGASWRQKMKPVSTAPIFFENPCPVSELILNVGDAAGFIDPFVGDGITLALESGVLAADALAPFVRGESSLQAAAGAYQQAYDRRLRPLFGRVAWLRKLLELPRPVQRAAVNTLRIPILGKAVARATRPRF